MIDNNKVIDGQKEVIMHLLRMSEMCSEDDEPYYDKLRNYAINTWALLENLLKEQEPLKPIKYNDVYWCQKCGNRVSQREININNHRFIMDRYKYCPECGRRVKWDE